MFQVTRFGGFSNRPKNDDQSKIDALLERLKKPQQPATASAAGYNYETRGAARVATDADSDDGSQSDSRESSEEGCVSSDSHSSDSSSDSDSGDSGSESDRDDDGQADVAAMATKQPPSVPTVLSTLNKPVMATSFEIARAMLAGTHNRANLLRKLGPISGTAAATSAAAAAAWSAAAGISSKAPSASSSSSAAARGGKPKATTTESGGDSSASGAATAGAGAGTMERREARRAHREKAATAARAAQDATWACLDPSLREAARSRGLRQWFPVQTKALPTMVAAMRPPGDKAGGGDFCIAAPTGSGKTLA